MSIRTKIFLILGVSQLILVLLLTVASIYLILTIKNEPQTKRAQEQILLFQRQLNQKKEKMELVLKNILRNADAIRVLNFGFDSRKFLEDNEYYFQNLMKTFHLDILELGDSSGKVYYRFHNPTKYGEDKSYQKIIESATKGEQATALEVGNSGLALRTVVPFNDMGTIMAGELVNNQFLAELSFNDNFHIAVLQEDALIAASSGLIERFLKENPIRKIAGKRKKFESKYYYAVNLPYEDKGFSSIQLNFLVLLDETELQFMIRKAWWTLAAISLVMLLFIFLISFLFSRDILESFKVLVQSMKDFREENDEPLTELVSKRRDELGEMANIFLGMKTDLGTYQNNLEELVQAKTNELVVSNQKLDHANETLRNKQIQIEHEFMVAQSLQAHLVPDPDKLIAPLQVKCVYEPASGVSGDIYDFGMLGDRECYFFMADVSGHGVPAAMVTAMVKISLAKIPLKQMNPAEVLKSLNNELVSILDDHYFTAFLCKIDFQRRTMIYASAGATPAILLKTLKHTAKILKPTGTVMGVFEDMELETHTIRLEPGDKLFIFTDGISEETNSEKRLFGVRRVIKHLIAYRFHTNQEILQTLMDDVTNHAEGGKFKDDISCILANVG
jgi:serine phosphatase RsbU (regulator of sigma subunit)